MVGLGYVGLPLAVTFGEAGVPVLGLDAVQAKVDRVNAGESYIEDVASDRLAPLVREGTVRATTSWDALRAVDAILICLPTPLTEHREPDLSAVLGAAESLSQRLRPGHLVVLESTTYPGTTREEVAPVLERSGLRAGRDFHLAFSPERVDPGRVDWTTATTPKVIGGLTPACTRRAMEVYGLACETLVPVGSPEVAELTKLLENIFRSVNIALVNELAMLCDRMGIDVWDVIEAAATKPFGFMPFRPGPGLGGHCIPIDPFYLTWKAREFDLHTEFIELAGKVNSQMPQFCVAKVGRALNSQRKALNGSRVLVVGRGLQGERQRHAREPGAEGDRAAARRRRAGRVPRPPRRRAAAAGPGERAARRRDDRRLRRGGGGDGPRGGRLGDGRPRRGAGRRPAQRGPGRQREGVEAVTISVGVVGMNYWGPNLARNFARIEGCRLAWVCDRDEAVLDRHRSAYPDSRFTSRYEDLLEDAALDAVVIATPVPTHAPLARLALEAGHGRLRREAPRADRAARRTTWSPWPTRASGC